MRGCFGLALAVATACSSPPPPPSGDVVADSVEAHGLALDATYLYWTSSDGDVSRRALDGTGDAIALVSGQARPASLVVDSTSIYWTNLGTTADDGGVMTATIGESAPTPLVTGVPAGLLATSSTTIYWANDIALYATLKVGGANEMLAYAGGFLMSVDGVALDDSYVYCNIDGPERLPVTGGAASAPWDPGVATGPGSLVVDATDIYWTVGPQVCDTLPCPDDHQGYVMTAPLAGGATRLLAKFTTPSYAVTPMALDATHVYWMTADSIQRIALDGSDPVETIAYDQGDPYALALGDNAVFWASGPVGDIPAAIRTTPK